MSIHTMSFANRPPSTQASSRPSTAWIHNIQPKFLNWINTTQTQWKFSQNPEIKVDSFVNSSMNDKYPEEVILKPWGVELSKMLEAENEA